MLTQAASLHLTSPNRIHVYVAKSSFLDIYIYIRKQSCLFQMIFNVTTIPEQLASVMSLYFSTANKETGMWQIEESSGRQYHHYNII